VAENCTDEIPFTVLGMKGVIVICKSIWSLTADKMGTDLIKDQIKTLDELLKHLCEPDSKYNTALPVLDLLSNYADETETKTMERLELGDATPEEPNEYLNAKH
jgi:hypothetical protein